MIVVPACVKCDGDKRNRLPTEGEILKAERIGVYRIYGYKPPYYLEIEEFERLRRHYEGKTEPLNRCGRPSILPGNAVWDTRCKNSGIVIRRTACCYEVDWVAGSKRGQSMIVADFVERVAHRANTNK